MSANLWLQPASAGPVGTDLVHHAHQYVMDGGVTGQLVASLDSHGSLGFVAGPTGGSSTFVSSVTGASGISVSGPATNPVVSLASYSNLSALSLGNASGPIASTAVTVQARVVDGIATVRFPTITPSGNGVTGTISFSGALSGAFAPAGSSDTMIVPISILNNAVPGTGTCNIGVPSGSIVITANINSSSPFFSSGSSVGWLSFAVSYPV